MGNSFTVQGEVALETGQVTAGTKEVRSELENLAKGGIAGFERTNQAVTDLTKEMGRLQKAILATDDPAALQKLQGSLGETRQRLQAARTEMRGMTLSQREAGQQAQLLASSFGVHLPAGLSTMIARTQAAQAALKLAFSATIVLAFAAAIVSVLPKLDEWMDKLRGIAEASADVYVQIRKANEALGAFGKPDTVEAFRAEIANVGGEIFRVRQHLEFLQTLTDPHGKPVFSPLMWTINFKEIKLLEGRLQALIALQEELAQKIPIAELKEGAKATKEFIDKMAEAELFRIKRSLQVASQLTRQDIERTKQQKELAKAAIDAEEAVRNAGMKIGNERVIEEAKMQEARIALANEAAQKQKDILEKTASDIENFIERVFLTARSFADVWRQFLMQLVGSFVKAVSHMIAQALLGMRAITASAGGGAGGFFGPILGAIFGMGGGGGGTALGAAAQASATGGAGITTGQNLAALGAMGPVAMGIETSASQIPAAAGGATQGALGALAFGKFNLAALGQFAALSGAGLGLALMPGVFRSTSPGGGAGLGALAGGLIGAGVGALGFGLVGALAFGPVGAFVGALIGLIAGIFGRGKAKRRAAALEQQFDFASDVIVREFERHRLDFDSAISQLQAMVFQAAEAFGGLGKPGRRSMARSIADIQNDIRHVENLQKQRDLLAGQIAAMTLPEFQFGGSVPAIAPYGAWPGYRSSVTGRGILALLHPGEFVMRREAVQSLGGEFLATLNRAPRFAGGGIVGNRLSGIGHRTINVHVYPSPGMNERALAHEVIRIIRRAEHDGAL